MSRHAQREVAASPTRQFLRSSRTSSSSTSPLCTLVGVLCFLPKLYVPLSCEDLTRKPLRLSGVLGGRSLCMSSSGFGVEVPDMFASMLVLIAGGRPVRPHPSPPANMSSMASSALSSPGCADQYAASVRRYMSCISPASLLFALRPGIVPPPPSMWALSAFPCGPTPCPVATGSAEDTMPAMPPKMGAERSCGAIKSLVPSIYRMCTPILSVLLILLSCIKYLLITPSASGGWPGEPGGPGLCSSLAYTYSARLSFSLPSVMRSFFPPVPYSCCTSKSMKQSWSMPSLLTVRRTAVCCSYS